MTPKPVKITDTILRDAHQSLLATRMRIEDMLPICEKLDAVGYHSLEVWGGATFDTTMRFLDEDPWERLRTLKKNLPRTPLQMLLRGQNVVGYRHYADDVLERFIVKARENGMDIFRIFDALNDVRNMQKAMEVVKREGGHVQAAISYTTSPVHSLDLYVRLAKVLQQLGADSLCIKDMAGLLCPYDAYELVGRLKTEVNISIQIHTHYTSGMGSMTYLKAIEAGADVVDTAISTMSLASSQPPTESMVAVLQGTQYNTGLDLELLSDIAKYFKEVRKKYAFFEGELVGVDTNVLTYQVPGGMISNLVSQLREQNGQHRLEEVLQEVPRVREDLGYPPLVTPTSQIVGTQAVLNVVMGERYKVVPKEVRAYIQGFYGTPPGPIKEELRKKICGDDECIVCRPADLLPPELEKAAEEIGDLAKTEEDVISYALFPNVARDFFQRRDNKAIAEREIVAAIAAVIAKATSRPAPAPAVGRQENGTWRTAGRDAQMRSRGWR